MPVRIKCNFVLHLSLKRIGRDYADRQVISPMECPEGNEWCRELTAAITHFVSAINSSKEGTNLSTIIITPSFRSWRNSFEIFDKQIALIIAINSYIR
jgi:hypothetical protein